MDTLTTEENEQSWKISKLENALESIEESNNNQFRD